MPQLCGQLLVGGFEGTSVPASFATAVRAGQRGGAILFKRNISSVEQARALCADLVGTSVTDLPLWLGVDEEGGRVSRLSSPVVRLPPMRRLAALGDTDLLTRCGRLLGQQLAAIGFNLDFAPVLDVDTNPANPVIGDRSFGATPDEVSRHALAFWQGLSESVLGCGKHFPGHGDTDVDSHVGLPVIRHDQARLQSIELPPFVAAARAGVEAFMTAHVVVTSIDGNVPATLSPAICTDLLRREIGYEGVLFSDDLEMRAVADLLPVGELAVRSIEAGCDVLLVCRSEALQEEALEALVHRAERDEAFRQRCSEAVTRGLAARRRRVPAPVGDEAQLRAALGASEALEAELRERLAQGAR